ncbi:uncharacterized protein LOC143917709 [Arctopsyche grandis]|uniref:uncharacterized protein LOC143917709 n=1 Tax=Arctopsyche grandis TaxID=121162 RepID=UPI00406DA132
MPQRSLSSSALMRPFVVLALPGMYLFYKYNQYKQQQIENTRRKVTERELQHLNHKIDKLLNKLEENEPELATCQEEECVICVNAKATMQTSPCGHRVVCRKCFVKTIQMAVSQRLLPLRCVICRAKILRLKQTLPTSKSWQVPGSASTYSMGKAWGLAGSASAYSVGAHSVPNSASLYSMTSGSSSLSGVSSVSSSSGGIGVGGVAGCGRVCGGGDCAGGCLGAVPRRTAFRQPTSSALRRSQHHSMKLRLQDYRGHGYSSDASTPIGRLPPIKEFQRDFRASQISHPKDIRKDSRVTPVGITKEDLVSVANTPAGYLPINTNPICSTSTRIRCAHKILTQLETTPMKKSSNYRIPQRQDRDDSSSNKTRVCNNNNTSNSEKESISANNAQSLKVKGQEEIKKKEDDQQSKKTEEKSKKTEKNDNKKNETAERKKEEKLKLRLEKEAKKEAKREAKEEERQAKQLAKEEKKKAKKEAKQALLAERDKK